MNLRAETRRGWVGRMVWGGKRAIEIEGRGHLFDTRGAQVQEIGLGRYIGPMVKDSIHLQQGAQSCPEGNRGLLTV